MSQTPPETKQSPVIFTPDDEPYLGRTLLFHFDQMISVCMEINRDAARQSHAEGLTDHQDMARIVIPQAISLALSIRELIRQGYLFGAHVLVRPLAERVAILTYLHQFPAEIEKWKRGWRPDEAPSLAKMFDALNEAIGNGSWTRGKDATAHMNTLLHGKPGAENWNAIFTPDGRKGQSVSKILNRGDLCDEVCAQAVPWLVVVQSMMATYFPPSREPEDGTLH